LDTPVSFIIFNRPDTTIRVFEQIRAARPPKLLVISDGPRSAKQGEAEKVALSRAIIDRVDWKCEVLKNYSETNLGCRNRVSSGISWVFEQVDRAIILEDDCLPHPSFFDFCQAMLDRYADDPKVMHISGDNFQPQRRTQNSYYFSKYTHIWGWASWRRAWKHYDVNLPDFSDGRGDATLRRTFTDPVERFYWRSILHRVYAGEVDTWDYQWAYACWRAGGLAVAPEVNLVSNIGFGAGATHTTGNSALANLPTFGMDEPLVHPAKVEANTTADSYTFDHHFGRAQARDAMRWRRRLRSSLGRIARRIIRGGNRRLK
jgi:hypothetical protein